MQRASRLLFLRGTALYRSVHTTSSGGGSDHHRGETLFPDWRTEGAAPTNHVGGLGVMSPRAAALRAEDEHHDHSHDGHGHSHDHHHHHGEAQEDGHGHGHGHSHGSSHKSSPFLHMSTGGTAAAAVATKATSSAVERLRASHRRQKQQEQQWRQQRRERAMAAEGGERFTAIPRPSKQRGGEDQNTNTTSDAAASSPQKKRTTRQHSGLQVEVLSLYRQLLKEARKFKDEATRTGLAAYIREDFQQHRSVPRTQFAKVEWHVNYAKRKLEEVRRMPPNTKFSLKH